MNTEEKDTLQSFVNELGLTYTATFVPTPQPAETVPHPQLHWSIVLQRGGRTLTASYSQGCGHAGGYKQICASREERRLTDIDVRKSCETGKIFDYRTFKGRMGYGAQPSPELLDVLACLVSDCSVLDMSSYEEWANEYGYDTDSRKAESVYAACLAQSLSFKALIGQKALDRLRELYQDY